MLGPITQYLKLVKFKTKVRVRLWSTAGGSTGPNYAVQKERCLEWKMKTKNKCDFSSTQVFHTLWCDVICCCDICTYVYTLLYLCIYLHCKHEPDN